METFINYKVDKQEQAEKLSESILKARMLCTIGYVSEYIARGETGWVSFELEIIKGELRYSSELSQMREERFSKGYWEKFKKRNKRIIGSHK